MYPEIQIPTKPEPKNPGKMFPKNQQLIFPSIRKPANVEITPRDLEILEFILDMKFASKEEIFEKFFRMTRNQEPAKSTEWTGKRLAQLEKSKYLKSVYSFSESRRLYLATLKSYYAVIGLKPESMVVKPVRSIDQSTYVHDKLVLKTRVIFEKIGKIQNWISDRKLRADRSLLNGLEDTYIPDAIYSKSEQDKVAFELEISLKARNKYREKIRKYVEILRNQRHKSLFSKVHYVCAKDNVYKILKEETKIYGDLFLVQKLDEIMPLTKFQHTSTN